MKSILMTAAALLALATPAASQNPDGVPAAARKLTASGIRTLYQGARATYENRQQSVVGEIFYDLTAGHAIGTFRFFNGTSGIFKGSIRVQGNQFCYKSAVDPEICTDVYLNGKTYYEVDDGGNIVSVDTLLASKPPAPFRKLTPVQVQNMVRGKRILVTVYDSNKPVVADVKWDLVRKASVGRYRRGAEEGAVNIPFVVRNNQICWRNSDGTLPCYDYYPMDNGFIEVNARGAVHAVSVFR